MKFSKLTLVLLCSSIGYIDAQFGKVVSNATDEDSSSKEDSSSSQLIKGKKVDKIEEKAIPWQYIERIINLERKIEELEESLAFNCAGGTCKGRDDRNYIIPTALIIGKENPDCTYGSPSLSVDAGIASYGSSGTSFTEDNSGSNCPSGSGAVAFGGMTLATGDGSFATAYGSEASGVLSSVTGGRWNSATGQTSSVSGGHVGVASGTHSSVSGGYGSKATSQQSSVLGGHRVEVSGSRSTGIGGYYKSCYDSYCIAQ